MPEHFSAVSPEEHFAAAEAGQFSPQVQERLVFGRNLSTNLEYLSQDIQQAKEQGESNRVTELTKSRAETLDHVRTQLSDLWRTDDQYAERFFEIAIDQNPDLENQLGTFTLDSTSETAFAEQLKKIPDEALANTLEAYSQAAAEQLKDSQKETRQATEELKDYLYREIDKGALPLSREQVDQRLGLIAVYAIDPLKRPLQETLGEYDEHSNEVLIDMWLSPKDARHVVQHELWHALSGRTIKEKGAETGEEPDERLLGRQGLRFVVPENPQQTRFGWLNEAVTETLAISSSGSELETVYEYERTLLQEIARQAHVDVTDFYPAYFEHYLPGQATTGVPAWKELNQKLDAAFPQLQREGGPGFLRTMDQAVDRIGEEKTLELLKQKNWDELRENK